MEDFSKAPLRVRFCENGSFFVGSHGTCGGMEVLRGWGAVCDGRQSHSAWLTKKLRLPKPVVAQHVCHS